MRLPPRVARYVTWPELAAMQYGRMQADQQALLGSRQVAWETHNLLQMMSAKPIFCPTPAEYWALPLVDSAAAEPTPAAYPTEALRKRLEARYGMPIVFETD